MKRSISILLSLIIICTLALSGCNKPDNNKNNNFKIVASFYPIYIMALNIVDGIDGVELSCMADNSTGCLHDFQLQTKDMKNIESANVFIINGAGMESFMDKVTNEISTLSVIDSSKNIELIPAEYGHNHTEDDDHNHEHSEYNGHLWLSIENYKRQVQNITDSLVELDPEHKEQYIVNSKAYIEKLDALQSDTIKVIDSITNKDIITFHEAFEYFAKEFGLNIALVIEREPGSEPSASELAETVTLINETNVNVIFVEPQYPRTSADTIASETDANVYTLDTCVTGDMKKDAYINAMRNNLQVLLEALK